MCQQTWVRRFRLQKLRISYKFEMVKRHHRYGTYTCMVAPMCQSLGPKKGARRTGMEAGIIVCTNCGPRDRNP